MRFREGQVAEGDFLMVIGDHLDGHAAPRVVPRHRVTL